MTREKVIKALKWFKAYNEEDYCGGDRIQDEHGDWYYRITEQDFEAFDVAIKALEQELTTKNDLEVDCIDRTRAIERLKLNLPIAHGAADNLRDRHRYMQALADIQAIRELPSVTSQEPRWIPVSERLPEEDGEYYATVYDTDENYKYMDIAELENGIWQYKDYIKVLAWMPLPKSYSEVEK